ncbi:hypothetical protein TcasGA2_TC006541 [Tribolium castaneum]|uniref:Uncharacterized protein n=1 Tax=Tribolium castaneum TaxID=7070 RepID=D6WXH0_TRICA|nr:hypothetical protein TcasGA2_TC006541 [Tribolium castaneum]
MKAKSSRKYQPTSPLFFGYQNKQSRFTTHFVSKNANISSYPAIIPIILEHPWDKRHHKSIQCASRPCTNNPKQTARSQNPDTMVEIGDPNFWLTLKKRQ